MVFKLGIPGAVSFLISLVLDKNQSLFEVLYFFFNQFLLFISEIFTSPIILLEGYGGLFENLLDGFSFNLKPFLQN